MFKISEFSRFTRVSVKMLRHYDRIGLLQPARIDPANKYRYYSSEQLPRLNRIIALKDLGFSLDAIATLLDDTSKSEEVDGMFQVRKAEIEQNIRGEKHRLKELESRIRAMHTGADPNGSDIILRAVPGQWIASIRAILAASESFAPLFDKLEICAGGQQVRAKASPFTIYCDDEYDHEELDVELAVPIQHAVPPRGEIRVRELPAEPMMACVTFRGAYAQTAELLNSLLVWVESHEYKISGSVREI
jgi:DNA-binding transcriptional MerR regulator